MELVERQFEYSGLRWIFDSAICNYQVFCLSLHRTAYPLRDVVYLSQQNHMKVGNDRLFAVKNMTTAEPFDHVIIPGVNLSGTNSSNTDSMNYWHHMAVDLPLARFFE